MSNKSISSKDLVNIKESSDEHLQHARDGSDFGGTDTRQILERKLLWKLDLRMSILVVMYILNFLARNNPSAARLRGLESDLHLRGQEFPTLLSVLYVGYIFMQIPSNILLNRIGKPSLHLPLCMMFRGMLSILTGITQNFLGALFTRFCLGFMDAAFFPGALFLISKWYKRSELGLRTAILCCGMIISNAFGSVLASAILDGMQGKLGRAAWRWLFYIEGSLSIFVAICAMFILPDFPATTRARWLSKVERLLAMRRMEEDAGTDEEIEMGVEGRAPGLVIALKDWKVWWMTLALTCQVVALSFNAYFPTLSATMGFGRTVSLLLCAPPFVFAAIVTFFVSRHSDNRTERFHHIAASLLLGIVGFVIAMCTMNIVARYISLFLMGQCYAGFVIMYAWVNNTFPRPPSKRAVALALVNAFSQLGNIAGSYVWPSSWGPTYRNSYAICIGTAGCSIAMCYAMRLHLASENQKFDQEEADHGEKETECRYWL